MTVRLSAFALAFSLALIPFAAHAGTTGTMRGRVVTRDTGAPISGVAVTALSPSGSASTTTDANGNFAFISLAPDAYTVSAHKSGYDDASQAGISVFADQSTSVAFALAPSIKTIANVRTRSGASLVHAGTTSDVYSVNASTQRAAQALGGSGALNQAYSAIAAAPGVSMPAGQQAWYQSVYIRGGDYDQVAYEFDGVPVIRESDSAPIVTLSALGQQEVQVYTGGTPATADSPGLAGYINQVIKTGTSPGFITLDGAIGGPTYYHKLSFEASGATPNRLFSYYFGTAGYSQTYRYDNQFNGASDPLYFFPLYIPTNNDVFHILDGSGGTVDNQWGAYFQPGSINGQAYNADRETVVNLHFGVPHHHDGGRDDIQLLYVVGNIFTGFYSSANDIGAANVQLCTPGDPAVPYCNPSSAANYWPGSPIPWMDSTYYTGPLMQTPNNSYIVNGPFPSGPTNRPLNNPTLNGYGNFVSTIDPAQRDTSSNGFAIEKFQYQRNINSSSYIRFNAYSEYTNWFIFGPNAAQLTFGAALPDYEVLGHIYGGNLSYSNQLSSKHLLTIKGSYMTQKLQTYNAEFGATGLGTLQSNYVDNSGNCYDFTSGVVASCFDGVSQGGLQADGSINLQPGIAPPGSAAANAGAHWAVTENGYAAQVDNVTPYFGALSATDVYQPNEKLTVNFGARVDRFSYRLNNLESGYPARQFWFNAFNRENCGAPGFSPVSTWNSTTETFGSCPTGFTPMWNGTGPTPGVGLSNVTGSTTTSTIVQPRIAFTYLMDPTTVLRGSYGRYARPAATSYQQYNTWEQDLGSFISQFYAFGYTTPDHAVYPDTADNFDFSVEKQIKGTPMSFKITPFYRRTHNQLQYLAINPLQGTLAGLNIGTQINSGIEFSFQDGDFERNGLSALFSYTHTNSKVQYAPVSNGASVIDLLNNQIAQYNSYTRSCDPTVNPAAAQPGTAAYAQCGSAIWQGQNASATLTNASGNPVSNPYYNSTAQPLLNRNGWYAPYDVVPAPFTAANGFETPDVASLILNYRSGKFAITPSLTYSSGSAYGSPLVYPGYVPQSCIDDPASTPMTPGRSCTGTYTDNSGATQSPGAIFLPDPYTGNKFDAPGSLREPSQLTLNLQASYDLSPRMTLTLIANNLYNRCFQRGYPWDDRNTCIYSNLPSNVLAPSGNFLSKSVTPVQVLYPYGTWFNNTQLGYTSEIQPFQITVDLNIRL